MRFHLIPTLFLHSTRVLQRCFLCEAAGGQLTNGERINAKTMPLRAGISRAISGVA
jgi:hypothetical protein